MEDARRLLVRLPARLAAERTRKGTGGPAEQAATAEAASKGAAGGERAAEPAAGERRDENRLASDDLWRTVRWKEHVWHLTTQGALVVKALVESRDGLTLAALAEKVDSDASRFKVRHSFRGRSEKAEDGTPTVGTAEEGALIVRVGAGKYALNPQIER